MRKFGIILLSCAVIITSETMLAGPGDEKMPFSSTDYEKAINVAEEIVRRFPPDDYFLIPLGPRHNLESAVLRWTFGEIEQYYIRHFTVSPMPSRPAIFDNPNFFVQMLPSSALLAGRTPVYYRAVVAGYFIEDFIKAFHAFLQKTAWDFQPIVLLGGHKRLQENSRRNAEDLCSKLQPAELVSCQRIDSGFLAAKNLGEGLLGKRFSPFQVVAPEKLHFDRVPRFEPNEAFGALVDEIVRSAGLQLESSVDLKKAKLSLKALLGSGCLRVHVDHISN